MKLWEQLLIIGALLIVLAFVSSTLIEIKVLERKIQSTQIEINRVVGMDYEEGQK